MTRATPARRAARRAATGADAVGGGSAGSAAAAGDDASNSDDTHDSDARGPTWKKAAASSISSSEPSGGCSDNSLASASSNEAARRATKRRWAEVFPATHGNDDPRCQGKARGATRTQRKDADLVPRKRWVTSTKEKESSSTKPTATSASARAEVAAVARKLPPKAVVGAAFGADGKPYNEEGVARPLGMPPMGSIPAAIDRQGTSVIPPSAAPYPARYHTAWQTAPGQGRAAAAATAFRRQHSASAAAISSTHNPRGRARAREGPQQNLRPQNGQQRLRRHAAYGHIYRRNRCGLG